MNDCSGCADSGMHALGPADNMVVVGGVCWLRIVAAPKNDPEWDALGLEEKSRLRGHVTGFDDHRRVASGVASRGPS
jgi:hypothetical protein